MQSDFFHNGAVGVDIFEQDGDMSDIERNCLADKLDDFVLGGTNLNNYQGRLIVNDRFRNCGQQGSRFGCNECKTLFYTRFFCKFKLCDRCARIYGKSLREKMLDLLRPCFSNRKKSWSVKMVTLSTSSNKYGGGYPSRDQYKKFNSDVAAFCRLHYGKYEGYWSRTGKVAQRRKKYLGAGTFAVNEFGQDNNNLHCHILLYGPWIPHEKLLESWIRISGGDRGCHVQPLRNPEIATAYVTKYLTKPPRFLDTDKAVDFIESTRHTRRIRTGGIFYNKLKNVKSNDPLTCPYCGEFLEYSGVFKLGLDKSVVDLRYARKNKDQFLSDRAVENAMSYLPEGATAVNEPYWHTVASNCHVNDHTALIKQLFA